MPEALAPLVAAYVDTLAGKAASTVDAISHRARAACCCACTGWERTAA